jgi:hypothetical protein
VESNVETSSATTAEKLPDPAGPKFAGVAIELGGKTYIVPGLSLRQVRDLSPEIAKMDGFTADTLASEYFDTAVGIILPAIQRNYPSITRDDLEDVVDLNNVREIIPAVTGGSTAPRVQPGPGSVPPVSQRAE